MIGWAGWKPVPRPLHPTAETDTGSNIRLLQTCTGVFGVGMHRRVRACLRHRTAPPPTPSLRSRSLSRFSGVGILRCAFLCPATPMDIFVGVLKEGSGPELEVEQQECVQQMADLGSVPRCPAVKRALRSWKKNGRVVGVRNAGAGRGN